MKRFIYKRENKINGKIYIGQTTNIELRNKKWENLNCEYSGKLINRARKKYGLNNFKFEILKEIEENNINVLKDKLNELEIKYIKIFDSFGKNGYNMTQGGNNTVLPLENFLIRNKKISQTLKGIKRKSIKHTELWNKHIGDGNRGHIMSEKQKKILSEKAKKRTGEKASFYGKHHTKESKKKISENNASVRPVLQIDSNNQIVNSFKSIKEASRITNLCYGSIQRCCSGVRKTCGGYKWRYKNEITKTCN